MNKFNVSLTEYTELEVTLHKHAVDIRSQDAFDIGDALKAVDKALANELREMYPNDYKFIVDDEDYGSFLTLGSPQFMECNWKLDYHTEAYLTSLSIIGLN